MKKEKAKESNDIPVAAWITLGNKGVEFLESIFDKLLQGEKMPDK